MSIDKNKRSNFIRILLIKSLMSAFILSYSFKKINEIF